MIVIPKRGMGRPTAAKAEAYRARVEAFCREIKKLRASLDFEVSAHFPTIEKLFVTCRKSGDLPLDICAEDEARAAEHIEKVTDENSEEFVRGWIEYVRDDACNNYNPISLWDESEYYCEMWVEKIDLKSLFSNICKRYTILCRVKHLNWCELNWPELPIRHPNQLWRHD